MNEELLLAIWKQNGYDQRGPFEKFKTDMMSSPDLRKKIYDTHYSQKGPYDKFEKDLGLGPQGLPPLPVHKQGPIGVARPAVMANPGLDNEKLTDYYKVDRNKLNTSILAGGSTKESIYLNADVTAEIAKESGIKREAKSAELINRDGDVLSVAKSVYATEFNKKKEKYSNDPQIADAEFSKEALAHYRENVQVVADRSRERLKLLYKDKYNEAEIDKIINTHGALTLTGNIEAANKMVAEHPDLLSDPNVNNIITANSRLRESALAEFHVYKNNPNAFKRKQKVSEIQQDVDEQAKEFKDNSLKYAFVHPSLPNTVQSFLGKWSKNMAVTPGMRDWGRDMMDFNPKSSDFQGRAIENYKEVSVGGKKYDVVYDGDKLEYIRDANGFMVQPDAAQLKAIKEAAAGKESKNRFNVKPFVGQTTDVVLDMAPIVALTYATGGIGTTAGLSATTARGIGIVAGSALQTRGDLMDQMLLHPDISPAEAEMYTLGIGLGVGAIGLYNPIEAKLITAAMPGIARRNVGKLINGQITKGQLAWETTKDVIRTVYKEPLEEAAQEIFQYGALKGVDATQSGYGRFNNDFPSLAEWGEIGLVSATVGLLGGAGSIRKTRNSFMDEAFNVALSNPKLVEDYLTEMQSKAETFEDGAKKQEALDHIARLRSRWDSIKGNLDSVKGLTGNKRGQLAILLADSNQLEAELKGVTNEAVKAVKLAEIKAINEEIKQIIDPKPAATATPAIEPDPTEPDADQDLDRAAIDSLGLLTEDDAEADIDQFEAGQTVQDGIDEGVISKVNQNTDGTTHSIVIDYTSEGAPLQKTIVVAKKTPKEIGIKILKDVTKPAKSGESKTDGGSGKTDQKSETTTPTDLGGTDGGSKKTDGDVPDQPSTPGSTASGDSTSGTVKTKSDLDPENNPALRAEIDKENKRLSSERSQALIDLADLLSVDPDIDAEPIRKQIEDEYAEGVKKINVSSRINLLVNKREADIKKAKEAAKRRKINLEDTGTIDRIKRSYDDQIAAVEKEFGVADELKTEAAAKKDVITGEIEAQRDEKEFPRKDYESNPNFQSIQKKYQKSRGKAYGKSVSRTLPSGEKVTGKYVLINKKDIAASHLPKTFSKTPGVPVTPSGNTFNDNDYETSRNAQATQTRIAKNFDERAIDDIVFVDSNGIVKSGNGRTISRQMSSAENSKKYLDALKARAKEFGFTEKQIQAIGDENVMLAVELEGDPVYNTKEYSKFNATAEKQKSPLQKAISIAKSIGEKTIGLIANVFDQADVMSDLGSKDIQRIKAILLKADIITELDQSLYFDENDKLTPSGSELVENILLSSIFNEDELRMLANNPKLRRELSKNRVRLLKNSLKDRLSIIPKIRQALYLINAARQFEGSFENRLLQQITQGSLLESGDIDDRTVNVAVIMNNADMLRKTLDYLNTTEEAADLFGNTVSSDQIVAHTLESLKTDLNEEGKRLLEIAARIPGTRGESSPPATDEGDDTVDGSEDVETSNEADESVTEEEGEGEVEEEGEFVYNQADIDRAQALYPKEALTDAERKALPPWEDGKVLRGKDSDLQNLSLSDGDIVRDSFSATLWSVEVLPQDRAKKLLSQKGWHFDKQKQYFLLTNADDNTTVRLEGDREIYQKFSTQQPSSVASVPVMITKKMEADLRAKGYSQADIDRMTPQQANDFLKKPAPKTKTSDNTPQDGESYNSAVIAFANSKTGDQFRLTTTNPNAKSHHGGTRGNTQTSTQIVIRTDEGFVPEEDINKPVQSNNRLNQRRIFNPENLDKNNNEIVLTKIIPQNKPKTKTQEKLSDIDSQIDDIFDYFKKLSIAATPEQQAEDMRMGIKLINLYIQKGIYTIKGIIEDMMTRMDKETAERLLPYVKRGYLSSKIDLDKNIRNQMDSEDAVLDATVEDFIASQPNNEIIEQDETREEQPESEEETDSEDEPGDTDTIIGIAEAALSQAEVAATSEEILNSLKAVERAIELATSKLGLIVGEYNTDGIEHELPNIPIGKQAAKDIRKHAKEIGKLTGWEVSDVYPNIAPAGGDVYARFFVPGTELSVSLSLNYEPDYSRGGGYDNYTLRGARYTIYHQGGVSKKGLGRHITGSRISPVVDMSAKDLALALFKAAKPHIAKELKEPVEIPSTITEAPDLGPLFAGDITKTPNLEGNSDANVTDSTTKPKPTRRPGKGGARLDRPHPNFQQGLLFGAETERDPGTESTEDAGGISSDSGRPEGQVPTGGRGGSGQSNTLPGTLPLEESATPKDEAAVRSATNYQFPSNLPEPKTFSPKQRFKDNLESMKVLRTLLRENRDATPAEQEVLAKYVGWGALKVITFDDQNQWPTSWESFRPLVKEAREVIADLEELGLKNLLRNVQASIKNAHYTSLPIIRGMYSILYRMGFTGGKVLEPSAGIGNFFGVMPGLMAANSQLHAVELEPLTGHILKKLYPKSISLIRGYQEANYPKNNFDLVISNIPFGDYPVEGISKNESAVVRQASKRIHNYFFAKGLEQVKEGGIVAFVTTAGVLDSRDNQFIRDHLNNSADFLGAIRLPSSAFKGNAGTEVTTDIIFLRKNTFLPKNNPPFTRTVPITVNHKDNGQPVQIHVNEYFLGVGKGYLLGTLAAGGLQATRMTVVPDADFDVEKAFQEIEYTFPTDVFAPFTGNPGNVNYESQQEQIDPNDDLSIPEDTYYQDADGSYVVMRKNGKHKIAKAHEKKVPAFIKLRDLLRRQYELESSSTSDEVVEENRVKLAEAYKSFVDRFKHHYL